MSLPIANFGFSRDSLNISFINLSFNINGTTTYLWDFGDGNLSILKDPLHVYASGGFFNVILTATTGAEISTISMNIGVGIITTLLNVPLLSLCSYYLPSTLLVDSSQLVTFIQMWQVYLQPLVENPLVDTNDTHNELKWPALVNKLIAMLVAKEIILKEANAFMANMANEGATASSSNTSTGTAVRSIKSIETGPARTEWFEGDDTTSNSETLKNIGASFTKAMAPNGILDKLQEAICGLSNRLQIFLPGCKQSNNIRAFQLGATPNIGSSLNDATYITTPWELSISF